MKRLTYTSLDAIAGCFTCNGSDYIWHSKNALAIAAKHHDKTRHPTWCDQNLSVRYGEKNETEATRKG